MKKDIIAKTFTPVYDEIEDRLRVVINYEDMANRIDFMITRNFILNLIPSAEDYMTKYYGVTEFEQNVQIQNEQAKDKERSFSKTDGANFELLKTDEALLREVNFSFDQKTKNTVLRFSGKNISASVVVNADMLQQIFNVIKSAIPYIRWGISHHF